MWSGARSTDGEDDMDIKKLDAWLAEQLAEKRLRNAYVRIQNQMMMQASPEGALGLKKALYEWWALEAEFLSKHGRTPNL